MQSATAPQSVIVPATVKLRPLDAKWCRKSTFPIGHCFNQGPAHSKDILLMAERTRSPILIVFERPTVATFRLASNLPFAYLPESSRDVAAPEVIAVMRMLEDQ